MLAVLNFCSKDRDMALNLLKWIQELGDVRRHDIILLTGIATKVGGLTQELELLAHDMFGNMIPRVTDTQEERGWPMSPNNAWRDTVFLMRMKIGRPWLWLEPDCVPITPDWLDKIELEYEVALKKGKAFMGGEIMNPQHRMSGPGVYHKYVTNYTRRMASLPLNVPFDQYFARDIVPNAHFTTLIQNIWNVEFGKPETIPTFPDQESLKLLDPNAVLFHRNKDGTLIQRLRERGGPVRVVSTPSVTLDADVAQKRIRELEAQILQNQKLPAPTLPVMRVEGPIIPDKSLPAPVRRGKRMKQRTPEQQAAMNERMAKIRAAKKATATA